MRRFQFCVYLILIISGILVSPSKGQNSLGVGVGDRFQLSFYFKGELKDSYMLPHTNLSISEEIQPLVIDYTIEDIVDEPNDTNSIMFTLESQNLQQNLLEFKSPLDLIDSYILSNESYFQPPPVIPLDIEDQFERLFTFVNEDVKTKNNTQLLDLHYTNENDQFQFFIVTNHTYGVDNSNVQESVFTYNKRTGILETYESYIFYWNGDPGGYLDELLIENTSPSPDTTSNDEYIDTITLIIILILVITGYFVFKFRSKQRNLTPPEINLINREEQLGDLSGITPTLTQRKVDIRPKVIEMIVCPSCKAANGLDSLYCIECGTFIGN